MRDPSTTSTDDRRAAYTAGLRALADLIDAHPELPLPYEGTGAGLSFHFLSGADPKGRMAAVARIFPGRLEKNDPNSGSEYDLMYYQLRGRLHGLLVDFSSMRNAVCERVVVGTETVTVPAVEAQPERTETREVVEWRCRPLLAERDAVGDPRCQAVNDRHGEQCGRVSGHDGTHAGRAGLQWSDEPAAVTA